MRFTQLHLSGSEPAGTSRALRFPLGAGTYSGLHLRGAKARGGPGEARRSWTACAPPGCAGAAGACSPPWHSRDASWAALCPRCGASGSPGRQRSGSSRRRRGSSGGGGGGGRRPPAAPPRRTEAQAEGAFAMRSPRHRRAAPGAAHPPAALALTGVRRDLRGGRRGAERSPSARPAREGERNSPGASGRSVPLCRSPSLSLPSSSLFFPPPLLLSERSLGCPVSWWVFYLANSG